MVTEAVEVKLPPKLESIEPTNSDQISVAPPKEPEPTVTPASDEKAQNPVS